MSVFYDLAKASVNRLAFAWRTELSAYGATAVALTPGWIRSEGMLEHFGVTEENWRDAADRRSRTSPSRRPRRSSAARSPHSPPTRTGHRWTGQSVSSGELAQVYGFTDVDGSRPDAWRYIVEVEETGKPADTTGYR